ncbi:MAG: hypothetical protein LCH56_14155 [Proteobacteria bacterium]|nr:hypothetical protein [Pseudomonadota bacterium]
MATTWLTHALNALPSTLAIHDGKPIPVDYSKPLSRQLSSLREAQPGLARYGLVHSVNGTSLFYAYAQKDLVPGHVRTAQLCRNPIMLAESMAAVTTRDWVKDLKFQKWSQGMCASVLQGRLNKVAVDWPASVKAPIAANDEAAISRLIGIWNRTLLEATDLMFCSGIHQLLAERGNKPEEAHPIFRFEDYTSDRSAFGALCNHVAGEALDSPALDAAFATPAANRHRSSVVTDPDEVYRDWTPAERDMFNTIAVVTGLAAYFESRGLYKITFVWSERPVSYTGSQAQSIQGVPFNVAAIMAK